MPTQQRPRSLAAAMKRADWSRIFRLLPLFWQPLFAVLAGAAIWWSVGDFGHRRYEAGYQQAVSENTKALADWKNKYDAQAKADEVARARERAGQPCCCSCS